MDVRGHPRYGEFGYRVRELAVRASTWTGVTFRSIPLEYASPDDILSGEGTFRAGGRWNAPRSFPVIYSSTRPGAAAEEAFQLADEFEIAQADLRPRLICGIKWELSSVIDLTVAKLPGWIDLPAWMREDRRALNDRGFESLCQAFGRAARNNGVTGILCPSSRVQDAVNLVVFRDRLRQADKMRVLGEDEIKKHLV